MKPMGPPGPREAIEAEVERIGCRIRPAPGGFGLLVDCPTHLARARLLNAGAEHDARYDPRIRRLAMEIASTVGRDQRGKLDEVALAARIFEAVNRRVRFLEEGAERFSKAWDTWRFGVGDCDDAARLLLALYRSVGIPAKLIVFDVSAEGADDLLLNHATVLVPVGGKQYWAEASVYGARFGEEPLAAARRVGATRTELGTSDLRGIDSVNAAQAFRILRSVWPVELLEPTPFALSYAVAWSSIDGAWGTSEAMPYNWGAVHCSARPDAAGNCPPGCVAHVDHHQDHKAYDTCFKSYAGHPDGARDFLVQLFGKRPKTRAALAAGESVEDVVEAMLDEHYFGGFCPEATKRGFGRTSPECREEVIRTSADALRARSTRHAREAGEVDGLAMASPSAPATGGRGLLVAGLVVAAAAGLGYVYRRQLFG